MTKLKIVIKKNYDFLAAGRFWIVRRLKMTVFPDASLGLSEEEIERIHLAVANHICGETEPLLGRELEFLCNITLTKYTEVSDYLDIHKSTVTKWRHGTNPIPSLSSRVLKRWFWFKLFGDEVKEQTIPFSRFQDDSEFLQFAKGYAINEHLAESVVAKVA